MFCQYSCIQCKSLSQFGTAVVRIQKFFCGFLLTHAHRVYDIKKDYNEYVCVYVYACARVCDHYPCTRELFGHRSHKKW